MNEKRHNDDAILAEIRGLKELFINELKHVNLELEEQKRESKERGIIVGTRITAIEIWQANSVGKIAIISTIIGLAIMVAVAWVNSHFK